MYSIVKVVRPNQFKFARSLNPLTIDQLFNETLGVSSQWAKAAELQKKTSILSNLQFIDGGCTQPDGSRNCVSACADSSTLFADFPTLWNCFMLTAFALVAEDIRESWSGLYDEMSQHASQFGVSHLSAWDSVSSLNNAFTCANMSCVVDGSACSVPLTYLQSHNLSGIEPTILAESLSSVCDNVLTTGNADIAGPGILVMHTMQSLLVVYLWLTTGGFNLKRSIRSVGFQLARRLQLTSIGRNEPRASSRLKSSRLRHAAITVLHDFYVAQAGYVFVESLASPVYIKSPLDFGEVQNLGDMITNYGNLQTLAVSGATGLLLSQATLIHLGQRPTYTVAVTTIVSALAFLVISDVRSSNIAAHYGIFQNHKPLKQCGGNPSLRAFCASFDHRDRIATAILARTVTVTLASLLIMTTLAILLKLWFQTVHPFILWLVDMLISPQENEEQRRFLLSSNTPTQRTRIIRHDVFDKWKLALACFNLFLLCVFELLALICCLHSAYMFIHQAGVEGAGGSAYYQVNPIKSSVLHWNIGQVVASLTYFAAPVKYIYTLAVGQQETAKSLPEPLVTDGSIHWTSEDESVIVDTQQSEASGIELYDMSGALQPDNSLVPQALSRRHRRRTQ